MRTLKVLVIVMGILIVAAVVTIAVALVDRAGDAASGKAWARALLAPAGATIRDYRLDGDRLVIRLAVPGKPDALHIIDLARGRPIGVVTIRNAK
jgi:hypothetical protein